MWIAIVGSRSIGECDCDTKQKSWPPTPEEKAHQEECPKVVHWLLMLKILTRLVTEHPELCEPVKAKEVIEWGIVSGGARGADTLAMNAAEMLGVPKRRRKEILPATGSQPFHVRAKARNTKIVERADMVIAVFGPGPRSRGTMDTLEKAKAKGVSVHVWHEGQWSTT